MASLIRYVALLRGINVGGNHKMPMSELAQLFHDQGCREVQTYIQSGNVIFNGPSADVQALTKTLAAAIQAHFGFAAPVIIRTAAQIEQIIAANPFGTEADLDKRLHVLFLNDAPAAEKIALLDPNFGLPDRFVCRDRDIYLWTPNGLGETRLTNAYFDSKLRLVSTARNWRTVGKIWAMMENQPK